MKKFFSLIWEFAKMIVIASLIVIPVRYFLFQPFFVRGQSMSPNFADGDYLIVDEISYRFRAPERGEIIVFKSPTDNSQRLIKRIIGLPGETVEIQAGKIAIEKGGLEQVLKESNYLFSDLQTSGDIKIVLAENEYFVLGDNRDYSLDSRRFGPVAKDNIIGRVLFRAWPFVALAKFEAPSY